MGSSLGFGPNPSDYTPYSDSLSLRLRVLLLNLATEINSQAHSPRGTLSGIVGTLHFCSAQLTVSPPTVCRLSVSGSISLP